MKTETDESARSCPTVASSSPASRAPPPDVTGLPGAAADDGTLRTPFPSFLPNPGRILLGVLDKWTADCAEDAAEEERIEAARALGRALQAAGAVAQPRLEAIHVLVRAEKPPPAFHGLIEAGAPCAAALMR